MARLQEFYKEKVVPGLIEKFGYKSVMEVPRITKITLNMGLGEAVADKKIIENAVGDLTKIAGQKPVITKARKAIAGFKIRGVSGRAFDGRGNYNIGVKEQIIFPEIDYDKIDALRGLNISITTTAKTDDEAKALLASFKFPFRN
jgi:large subunit ribosomal protein L5